MTNLSDYHAEKGVQLLHENNFANAIDEWDKAIEIDPGKDEYYFFRSSCKFFLKRYEYAIKDLDKGLGVFN